MTIEEEQISLTDKVKRYEKALDIFASMAVFLISNPISEMFMKIFFSELLSQEQRELMASISKEFSSKARKEKKDE